MRYSAVLCFSSDGECRHVEPVDHRQQYSPGMSADETDSDLKLVRCDLAEMKKGVKHTEQPAVIVVGAGMVGLAAPAPSLLPSFTPGD